MSKKMTNAIAEQVAKEVVKPLVLKAEQAKKDIDKYFYQEYKKTIPKEAFMLMDSNSSYSKFISTASNTICFYLQEIGETVYCPIPEKTPIKAANGKIYKDDLSSDVCKELVKLYRNWDKCKQKAKETENEIFSLLKSFSTVKAAIETLPQLEKFLSPYQDEKRQTSTGLIPVKTIEKIDCLVAGGDCINKI